MGSPLKAFKPFSHKERGWCYLDEKSLEACYADGKSAGDPGGPVMAAGGSFGAGGGGVNQVNPKPETEVPEPGRPGPCVCDAVGCRRSLATSQSPTRGASVAGCTYVYMQVQHQK